MNELTVVTMTALISLSTGTRQSSDLSRNSNEVFAEADERPIIITRRDDQNLVLMPEREVELRERALQIGAQIIAATTDDKLSLGTRMARGFNWMMALSPQSVPSNSSRPHVQLSQRRNIDCC